MIANSTAIASESAKQLPLPSLPFATGMYFAARLCLTYLFFQSDPQQGAIVSFMLNMLLFAAIAFYCFGAKAVDRPRLLNLPCLRWVIAFLAVSLCSLLWSETVSVSIAFAYWCGMAADVAVVLLLLRTGPLEQVAIALLKGYVAGACIIASVMWLSPTMQDLRLGNDEFFSPNAIGFTCAFGVFMAQYRIRSSRVWLLPAAFLSISLLRSLSKTTIIAFLTAQLFLLAMDRTIQRRTKLLFVVAGGAVILAFSPLIAAYYVVYTNAGNQAETLTGRIGIWAFVLERSIERPWFGHGFHSFRNVIPPFGDFEAWHAHNELIQQFYAYGIVGIVLLIGIYGSFFRQVRRITRPEHRTLFLGLIIFIAIRGFGDTERFDLSFPLWSIALLSLMLAASEKHIEEKARA